MVIIGVDGSRSEMPFTGIEDLCNRVGGQYRIACQFTFDGVSCYAIERADAWRVLGQNMTASLLCGKMLWGTVAFVARGDMK